MDTEIDNRPMTRKKALRLTRRSGYIPPEEEPDTHLYHRGNVPTVSRSTRALMNHLRERRMR